MALTLNNFCGFETGGLEEVLGTSGGSSVGETAPRTGDYALEGAASASADMAMLAGGTFDAGSKYIVGLGSYLDTAGYAEYIISAYDSSGLCWRLAYNGSTGLAQLKDANGSDIGSSFAISREAWCFIEAIWDHSDSGSIEVFVDGSSKVSASSQDLSAGGSIDSTAYYKLDVYTSGCYADDFYCMSGATDSGDLLGDAEVFRYQNGLASATGDWGTDLATGNWGWAGGTPAAVPIAAYTDTGAGGAWTDDTPSGKNYRHGPHGDSNIDGTIIAGKWGWWVSRGNGGGTSHYGLYGNDGDQSYAQTAEWGLSTEYGWREVISESGTYVPTVAEHFAQGFQEVGARDLMCMEQWAFILHVPPSGSTQYKSLAGGLTPAGVVGRWPMVARAGSLTPTGALPLRQTYVTRQGTLPSAGAVARKTSVDYGGTLTPTGVGSGVLLAVQAVSGVLGSAGGLVRQTYVDYAGVLTPTGVVTRWPKVLRAGALGLAGAVATVFTQVKSLAGGLTPTGVGTGVLLAVQSVAGSLTPAGVVVRKPLKALAGVLAPAGAVATVATWYRALAGALTPTGDVTGKALKALSGALSPVGTVATVRTLVRAVAGTLPSAGALARWPKKALAGGLTPTGSVVAKALKALAGALTPTGDLSAEKLAGIVYKAVGGALTPTGVVVRWPFKMVGGTLGAAGAVLRNTKVPMAGGLTPTGAVVRSWQTFKAVAGTLTPTGALATATLLLQAVGGTLGLAGVVTRYAKKELAGTLGAAGGLGRSIGKAIGGVLGAIGALVANFIPPNQVTIELEASYEDTLALAASHHFLYSMWSEFIFIDGGSYVDTIELEASYGD